MTQQPAHLLEFTKPPLTEVAIGVQFATLSSFRAVHLGFLWEQFRAEFPHFVEQPPLNPAFETFGTVPGRTEQVRFELLTGPPLPRLWLLDAHGVELIQFQTDRFLHNWRKAATDPIYPRYEKIRERFLEELDLLSEFLRRENLGTIEPNQCELTYVNQIISESGEDLAADLGRIFRTWTGNAGTKLPIPYEDARFVIRFVLRPDGGEPLALALALRRGAA